MQQAKLGDSESGKAALYPFKGRLNLIYSSGGIMNPVLPQGYDYLWTIGLLVMLTPLASTILLAFIFSEVRKIRKGNSPKP